MRFIRVLLQIIILAAGGFVLAILVSAPEIDVTTTIIFLGFVGFLLALTLLLKEQTNDRLVFGYKPSTKPLLVLFMLVGIFGLFLSVSYFVGLESLPTGEDSCRALCGLILLAKVSFGDPIARLFASVLWFLMGVFFLLTALWIVKKDNQN